MNGKHLGRNLRKSVQKPSPVLPRPWQNSGEVSAMSDLEQLAIERLKAASEMSLVLPGQMDLFEEEY